MKKMFFILLLAAVGTQLRAGNVYFSDDFTKSMGQWPYIQKTNSGFGLYSRKDKKPSHYIHRRERITAPAGSIIEFSAEIEIEKQIEKGDLQLQAIAFFANEPPRHLRSSKCWIKTNGREKIYVLLQVPAKCKNLEFRFALSGIGTVKIFSARAKDATERKRELKQGYFYDDFSAHCRFWPNLLQNNNKFALYSQKTAKLFHYTHRSQRISIKPGKTVLFSAEIAIDEMIEKGNFRLQAIAFFPNQKPRHIVSSQIWTKTNGKEHTELLFKVPENCNKLEFRFALSGIGNVKIYSCSLSDAPEREKELNILAHYDFSNNRAKWQLQCGKDPDGKPVGVCITEKAGPHNYRSSCQQIPVEPLRYVSCKALVRIDKPLKNGKFFLAAVAFRKNASPITFHSPYRVQSTVNYQELPLFFQVPADTTGIELRLRNQGVGTAYIKSYTLEYVDKNSFEIQLLPQYSGTLEEQKILNSWACLTGSTAARPVVSINYTDPPAPWKHFLNLVWFNPFQPGGTATVTANIEDAERNTKTRIVKTVSLYVRSQTLDPTVTLTLKLRERSGWGNSTNHWAADITRKLQKNRWQKIVLTPKDFQPFPGDSSPCRWDQIAWNSPVLVLYGSAKAHIQIAGLQVHCQDGFSGTAFCEWQDPFWYYNKLSPQNSYSPPHDRKYFNFHGGGAGWLDIPEGRNYFLKLKELVPNLAIQSNLELDMLVRHRDFLKKHDIPTGFQNITPFLWQSAVEHNAMSTERSEYKELAERHHKIDYTSEKWRDIYREVARRFAKYGIGEYQIIDGHYTTSDEKAAAAFPRILQEKDSGIIMHNGKKIHFWDYFEYYTGFRWKPQDLNWNSWNEYKHTSRGECVNSSDKTVIRRGYLDMALRHYEYMRWHADIGEIFRAQNVRYFLMNNGDDWSNGNDWIWNSSTRGITGFVDETYFYHPRTFQKAYPQSLMLNEIFNRNKTHLRLIAESGAGGHRPIYWSPEFSYTALFDISASRKYDSLEIDWPGETVFENLKNPQNIRGYNRLCDYLVKCWAYNDATLFTDYKPAVDLGKIFVLRETKTMFAGPQELRMKPEESAYPVSIITPQLFPSNLTSRGNLIFNDLYALRKKDVQHLLDYLAEDKRNALVLHGSSAGREIDGTMWSEVFSWPRDTMNAPAQWNSIFGKLQKNGERFNPERSGNVLLQDEKGALLSLYKCPNGSKIYYCHIQPDKNNRKLVNRIIQKIMYSERVSPMWNDKQEEAIVRAYKGKNIFSFSVYAAKPLREYRYIHGGNNPEYPWELPNSNVCAEISVPPGKYLLYGMLTGTEYPVQIRKEEKLQLPLKNISCELYHLIPSTDKATLQRLKARTAQLKQWLNKRPR